MELGFIEGAVENATLAERQHVTRALEALNLAQSARCPA
jgi:hypothetical protein